MGLSVCVEVKGDPLAPSSSLRSVFDLELGFHLEKGFLIGRFKLLSSFGSSYHAATFAWWRYLSIEGSMNEFPFDQKTYASPEDGCRIAQFFEIYCGNVES